MHRLGVRTTLLLPLQVHGTLPRSETRRIHHLELRCVVPKVETETVETVEAERAGAETVEAKRVGAETEEEGLEADSAMRLEEDAEAATLGQVVGLEMRLEEAENWVWAHQWVKKRESKERLRWQ